MRPLFLSFSILAALAGQAHADAFGLKMGQAVETFAVAEPIESEEPFAFQIEPPAPEVPFDSYAAIIFPDTGLCSVEAFAPASAGAAGAKAAIALQAKLSAAFDKRFGKGVQEEFGEGTGTTEADLLANAVSVQKGWAKGENTLPKQVVSARLFLQDHDGLPTVSLAYTFDNEDACMDARNKAIDAAAEDTGSRRG